MSRIVKISAAVATAFIVMVAAGAQTADEAAPVPENSNHVIVDLPPIENLGGNETPLGGAPIRPLFHD